MVGKFPSYAFIIQYIWIRIEMPLKLAQYKCVIYPSINNLDED